MVHHYLIHHYILRCRYHRNGDVPGTYFTLKFTASGEQAAWALEHAQIAPRAEGEVAVTATVNDGPSSQAPRPTPF